MQAIVFTSPKEVSASQLQKQKKSVDTYTVEHLWDQPAVYCGTYHKYNNGSLFGAWLDMRMFDSYDEFIEVCHKLHADEEEPELMFQDYQCFPEQWYSESGMDEDTLDKIKEYCGMSEDVQRAFRAYISCMGDDSISGFEENYEGEYDSEEDFAEYIVNECYDLERMMGSLSGYFNYRQYARDLFISDYYFDDGYVFRR
jgi:antirestriction protein